MPTLHVRNVPDRLYERIQRLAEKRDRSLSAQVIALLDEAVVDQELRSGRKKVLARIRRHRFQPVGDVPASEILIREDRER